VLIGSTQSNEYGITNVSSLGRVSITVVPPRHQSVLRSRSQTPFEHSSRASSAHHSEHSGSHHSENSSKLSSRGMGAEYIAPSSKEEYRLREMYYRQKLINEGDFWDRGVVPHAV